MSLQHFADRLTKLGCQAVVREDGVDVEIDNCELSITFDADWSAAVAGFYRARQYRFDVARRVLIANRSAEYQLTRLDPMFFNRSEQHFADRKDNAVHVGPASREFLLSYFQSDRYGETFHRIRERIKRRYDMRNRSRQPARRIKLRADELMMSFYTARYTAKRKPRAVTIDAIAIERIRACLFSLAYKKGECWEVSSDIKSRGLYIPHLADERDEPLDMPSARYDASIVSYYKVAKSSQFPSQVFLSFYHILEYHFLRVADETLFAAVRSRLNDPEFQPTYANVSQLVAVVKKNDSTADEKQMLRDVLTKFVPEDDFVAFVVKYEEERGEKVYTGAKQRVFGEQLSIKAEKGHALSNAAALLKHIRNAIVHSSDRYSRDECFLPFSESEEIVVKYLPLAEYLAERIIFATAESTLPA